MISPKHALRGRGDAYPRRVFLFSGKRKGGKDFVTDLLLERIGVDKAVVIKISSPIKTHWAEAKGLDLEQLMSPGEYKEHHRHDMITWSEALRAEDPGCFCRKAVAMYRAEEKPIWIVSDIRRRTDIAWFTQEYGPAVRTIRVEADEDVRVNRGFVFTAGVDDKATECDLDGVAEWHWKISNNGNGEELENSIQLLVKDVQDALAE